PGPAAISPHTSGPITLAETLTRDIGLTGRHVARDGWSYGMRLFWHRSDVWYSPLAARSRSRSLPLRAALRATPAGSPLAPLDAALGEYHTSALQVDKRNRRIWYQI